jgi:Flp pilus assembly protein TadD
VDSILGSAWRALAISRFRKAQGEFASAVSLDPTRGDAWLGFAIALWRGGDRFAALGAARKAADMTPELVDAHTVVGAIQRQIGNLDGAAHALGVARELDPTNPEILRLLSDVYRRARRPADALTTVRRALEIDPSSIESLVCLADAMLANEELAEAERIYRVVLTLDRCVLRAAFGLGRVALARTDWKEAQAFFERALDITPNDPDVRYNLGLLHLRFGRYREGFAAYPAIMETDSDGARYYYHYEGVPRWSGEALNGRRLVIASEQGLGDHIMMARFLRTLPIHDPPIVVETPPTLMALFQRNFVNVQFERFTHWRPAKAFDIHLPIMQLPCLAGIAAASDICGNAYLRADPLRVQDWKARLGGSRNVRHVGIVWHGNRTNTRERWRAAPLRNWAPLAKVPGVHFHSLQLDATEAEIADAPFPLSPIRTVSEDMNDTAALLTALDAVVSVDTSTVHLAGALGRPTRLANSLVSDFRWGIDCVESPWYSSVRIVRQTICNDWEPVFQTIAAELKTPYGEFA